MNICAVFVAVIVVILAVFYVTFHSVNSPADQMNRTNSTPELDPTITMFMDKYKQFCTENKLDIDDDCFKIFAYGKIKEESYDVLKQQVPVDKSVENDTMIEKLISLMDHLKNDLRKLDSDLKYLKAEVNVTEIELNRCKKVNNEQSEAISSVITEMEKHGLNINVVSDVLKFSDHTKVDKGIFYLMIFLFVIADFCIIVVLVALCTGKSNHFNQREAKTQTTKNNQTQTTETGPTEDELTCDSIVKSSDVDTETLTHKEAQVAANQD